MPLSPSEPVPLFDAAGALSREYLLQRGFCCKNGCRNCPYGYHQAPVTAGAGPCTPLGRVPRRIVSLCPSNTEILHALGLTERIVGVDDWSDWPPEIRSRPRVGPDLRIDLDRVAALHPDLVLASLSVPGMEGNVEGLRRRGLPYVVLDPHGLAGMMDDIRLVAELTGAEEAAEGLLAHLEQRLDRLRARLVSRGRTVRVYWEWWPKPLFAPGRRNWLTEISELAGCVSVTGHVDAASARPDAADIVRADPEYIFLAWTGVPRHRVRPELVRRREGWDRITAVREGRILVLEEGLYCRPSPRLLDGLEQLACIVHPEGARIVHPEGARIVRPEGE